ncbi:MaoC family dehydratase N-terminal domain-containing protein [Streptomyces bobili]|uniref:FAS1-like dehydratase domain-containing protein n=1 Tax=Streptomyces bobili TaxID=67280 RepID=UPI00342C50A8
MPLNTQCVGMQYPAANPYPVEPGMIRRFAEAVDDSSAAFTDLKTARSLGHADVVAPPTFPFIVAARAMSEVVSYPDIGFDPTYLVHSSQRFVYSRPVLAGDRLITTLEITAARTLRGMDVLGLRADLTDAGGGHVVTAHMTFVSLSAVEGGDCDAAPH